MESILDQITSPDQLKALKLQQQEELAAELRSLITASVAVTGGHLASNLGTIELTIALLRNFDLLQDRLVWDVGHQSYAYKILTGRRDRFATLRQQDGLSGFPKREGSPYDSFNTGHSSTAVSAALGLSRAMRMQGKEGRAIAVVGDGAMTGGMFTEALNNINTDEDNLLIIINDNQMSIGKNVGLFSRHLADIRVSQRYIGAKKTWSRTLSKLPFLGVALLKLMNKIKYQMRRFVVPSHENIYFEALGLRYYGPIDGHDMAQLNRYLTALQAINAPIVLHVCTQKGRGYEKAELSPDLYHGVSPFSPEEGLTPSTKEKKAATHSFTKAFSEALLQEAEKNERIVAITAAMEEGTGLAAFARRYPERFYDVGIAEQHAVTFAAALAAGGLRPVVCIYATFLQRALDQLLHDVVLHLLFRCGQCQK